LSALMLGLALTSGAAERDYRSDGKISREVLERSLVSTGHPARLEQALAKARRGEAVTVGVIGGSITAGAGTSLPERRYGDRVAAWWRQTFPEASVRFVNAGIGATGSDYGALRVKRDLLSQHPDFVVVEYAVNDPNTRAAAETLEGLIRQVLRETNQPAVLLLFTMNQDGGNAQEWQTKVGRQSNGRIEDPVETELRSPLPGQRPASHQPRAKRATTAALGHAPKIVLPSPIRCERGTGEGPNNRPARSPSGSCPPSPGTESAAGCEFFRAFTADSV